MKITPRTYAHALLAAARGKKKQEVDAIADRFVRMCAERGELGRAERAIQALAALAKEEAGIISVTAAIPPEGDSRALEKRIRAAFGDCADIRISEDPSLIAGIQLTAGDIAVDASVATQIARLREHLMHEA